LSKPCLGDQLGRDEGDESEIVFAPEGEEPRINCWVEVECKTPGGEETISFMFVDGAYVRDHLFVDFCEGGHFYRYGWIPEDQVWIEDEMNVIDRVCTAVHETHERFLMKYKGENYESAHDSACVIERKVRSMTLEENVVLPHAEDIVAILELEGSGKDCSGFVEEVLDKHIGLVKAAEKQANNPVGRSP
jgi:hypothetical protein